MTLHFIKLFFAAFGISLLFNWLLIYVAPKIGLLAKSGQHRKHTEPTPLVGGLAMFIAIAVCLILKYDLSVIKYLLTALALITFVGLMDDKYQLPSWLRFVAQGVAIFIVIKYLKIELKDLGGLFGTGSIHLGDLSIAVTVFSAIGVINAINMSDGMDGLAASMVLLVLIAMLILGVSHVPLIFIMMGAIVGFLFFNLRIGRSHARVFMGDAGSLMLGFLVSILLIQYSQGGCIEFYPPVTALWLLTLPLFDAIAVLILRPLRGGSPFIADRIHYHHLLIDQGVSVNRALAILLLLQSVFIGIGLLCLYKQVPEYIQFYLFLLLFSGYFVFLMKKTS